VHMRTARMYGHAGSDVQLAYMSKRDIESTEANDPVALYRAHSSRHGRDEPCGFSRALPRD
jgi:2-oxoisovalerate dehydrogenase E1 component